MKIHYLQHVPFEDLANIGRWAGDRGHKVTGTMLFAGENLPEVDGFDWLVIMGGPMNIYEENEYPWLIKEKRFIEQAIKANKIVLGVCLGAQLIADVLGGPVSRNKYKEIGWLPVSLTPQARELPVFRALPHIFTALHWHGDTLTIPPGCTRVAESAGCTNQAFSYNGRVIGLQFHLESSFESINKLICNCGDELVEGRYIQTADEILSQQGNLEIIKGLMNLLLDNIAWEFGTQY